jgi:hypothetical protein
MNKNESEVDMLRRDNAFYVFALLIVSGVLVLSVICGGG